MTPILRNRIAQIRHGQVPKGYKKTRKGTIPVQWKVCMIGDIATVSSGSTPSRTTSRYWNGEIPWVTTGELSEGCVMSTNERISHKAIEDLKLKVYPVGTLLMAMYGQGKTRGTTAVLGIDATINQACAAITVRYGLSQYLYYFLQSAYDDIRRLSNVGNQENLNADIIKTYPVILPPLAEQRKIAKILATQDRVIELLNRKIEQLKLLKKYYLRKMFPQHGKAEPEVRFPGFTGAWEKHQLGKIFKKNVERNEGLIGFDKTISIASMTYNREGNGASEDSLSGYKVLRHGDVAFDGHTNKEFHYGRFVVNDLGDGIMSSRFSSLRPIDDIQIRFWKHYIHYEPIMGRLLVKATKAGTMMNELVVPEFLHQYLLLPSHAEQKKIGKFFDDLDAKIALLRRQHDEEVLKKKALMQLLLTGIVRVRGVESGVGKQLPADRNLLASGKQIRKERAKCRRIYQ